MGGDVTDLSAPDLLRSYRSDSKPQAWCPLFWRLVSTKRPIPFQEMTQLNLLILLQIL
jgi:hypothetical protein